MAELELATFNPAFPNPDAFDLESASFSYDEDTDTLIMYLAGQPEPAVSVNLDRYHFVLVDPQSHDVVGFQIEGFMRVVVEQAPMLIEIAEIAGVPEDHIEAARARVTPRQRKRIMSQYMIDHFSPAPA